MCVCVCLRVYVCVCWEGESHLSMCLSLYDLSLALFGGGGRAMTHRSFRGLTLRRAVCKLLPTFPSRAVKSASKQKK